MVIYIFTDNILTFIQLKVKEKKIQLKTNTRDLFFKKEFSKLKIKVALNWFEIVALFIVAFLGVLKTCFVLGMNNIVFSAIIAIVISILITLLFSCFRNYQLRVTRFDKEHIYKKISADLIEQSKSRD